MERYLEGHLVPHTRHSQALVDVPTPTAALEVEGGIVRIRVLDTHPVEEPYEAPWALNT